MKKLIDAEAVADLFLDMADFAKTKKERQVLLDAAKTIKDFPGESEERPFVWKVRNDCGIPYMVCPKCGFETQNVGQPRRERWDHCPGCGHKCLRIGSKSNTVENDEADNGSRNAEGYSDPTVYLALRNIENRESGFPDFGNGSGLKS